MSNVTPITQHPMAADAIRAARNRRTWGPWAARRYVERRHGSAGVLLYLMACQFEACDRARRAVDG